MFWRGLDSFLFPIRSKTWVTILRIGLGLQLVIYGTSLGQDWNYLFAATNQGLVNRNLTEDILNLETPLVPRLGWLVGAGRDFGLSEEWMLRLCWFGLLTAGLLLLMGWFSRPAAIAGWLLHLAARSSGGFVTYGVDQFMTIALFYLAIAPLPDRYSLDNLLSKKGGEASSRSGFQLRILQVHLCLIYFFGGLTKCLGAGWWNGTSLWRALTRPPFNLVSPGLLVHWSYLLPAAGIIICLLEIGYPIFIWPRLTRATLLAAILMMHFGIGALMGLHLFAFIMIVLNAAAFGTDLFDQRFCAERPV